MSMAQVLLSAAPTNSSSTQVGAALNGTLTVPAAVSGSSASDTVPKTPALRKSIEETYKRMFHDEGVDDSRAAPADGTPTTTKVVEACPPSLPPSYEPPLFLDDGELEYDVRIAMLLQAQESFGYSADLALIQDMIVADLVINQEQQQVYADKSFAQSLQRKYQEHANNTTLTENAILNMVLEETAVNACDGNEKTVSPLRAA